MEQLVKPRTGVTDGAGWCHRMARAVFNAPLVYGLDSATKAANATKYRHTTRKMPNVAVPVWFWHYGTYGGVTGEFGHVVVWVPGRGFLTSPWYLAHGQEWYSTLEEIERRFNAKYRFWSEDINGLRVAEPKSIPVDEPEEEDEDMWKPTVHTRLDGKAVGEYMLAHPDIGKNLKKGESRKDGAVTVFRGYMVAPTTKAGEAVGVAWARMYAKGAGSVTSSTNRAGYIAIQGEATRVSVELYG
ncbi:MAG: hypothetical protein ACTIJ6_05280 [Leucobacter sp.]